ncbi:MAG: GNAT family N-acetyltransferase [Coriobacteriales bacterium]|jgi:GNAT superfamily N-acetyltransferase|nr:GNAT family N-acetyltransferase [Coriobacteriales bacterium]
MVKKPLPTGEEPPRGYETLVRLQTAETLKVNLVTYTQLARTEKTAIENLRSRALSNIGAYIGLSNAPMTFEQEVQLIDGRANSDKMLARGYFGNMLAGYALIVLGWPEPSYWLIQHMIIDPTRRNLGIGTAILDNIERYALESEVDASSILAVPIQHSGKDFWKSHGFTAEAFRQHIKVANIDHEIVVYRKEL